MLELMAPMVLYNWAENVKADWRVTTQTYMAQTKQENTTLGWVDFIHLHQLLVLALIQTD